MIVSLVKVAPRIFIVLSPIASFVFNNRKISELLNRANNSNPITSFLYSGVAIFQYLKKEKKFPFSNVERLFFFFQKKNKQYTDDAGNKCDVKKCFIIARDKIKETPMQ